MGMFQALLLAASLGWSTVLAQGGPPDWPSNSTASNGEPYQPHMPSSLPASIPYTPPSSMPSYIPAPTHPGHTGPPQSHPHPTERPSGGSWPGHTPSHAQQSNAGTTSGGILVDTAPVPTAIKTYYVDGQPIVAGSSAKVIEGTTYSVAATGTELYANGKPTTASHAIIGGGGGGGDGGGGRMIGTKTGSGVTSASSGAASSPASTAGAPARRIPGMLVGVVVVVGVTGALL